MYGQYIHARATTPSAKSSTQHAKGALWSRSCNGVPLAGGWDHVFFRWCHGDSWRYRARKAPGSYASEDGDFTAGSTIVRGTTFVKLGYLPLRSTYMLLYDCCRGTSLPRRSDHQHAPNWITQRISRHHVQCLICSQHQLPTPAWRDEETGFQGWSHVREGECGDRFPPRQNTGTLEHRFDASGRLRLWFSMLAS